MPKKPPKNAFFYYMLDFKKQQENRGVRFRNGLSDVSTAASPSWQKMTSQERGPYEKAAKDGKILNTANNAAERYTTQGVAYSTIDKQKNEEKKSEADMKKHISEIVTSSYLNNNMEKQEYFFIACNYFCITSDKTYIPAELAIFKYNLEAGKLAVYHTYVAPDKLPSGYAYVAKAHSEEKHRLPPPPNAKGVRNYKYILSDIAKFIGDSNGKFSPLFTNVDQLDAVKSIIQQICMDADEDENVFKVYPLAQLFYVLKEKAAEYSLDGQQNGGFASIHIAQAMLDRDQYDYCKMIACQFHESEDVSKFCALSCVTRWSFMFSDHICLDLNIEMKPGQHLPINADLSVVSELKSDLESSSFDDNESVASSFMSAPNKYTAPESVMSATSSKIDDFRFPGSSRDHTAMDVSTASSSSNSSASSLHRTPKHSPIEKNSAKMIKMESPTDDDDDQNPWTSQTKHKARKPKEASLSFNAMPNRGRGRGALLVDDETTSFSSGRGSRGRGRF